MKTRSGLWLFLTLFFALVPAVWAAIVSIEVTPANPTIQVGQTQQFTATGTFNDGSTQVLGSAGMPAKSVAAGHTHTCAVLSDSTVTCWGNNEFGQLGNGTKATSGTPVLVSGITTATAVAAGPRKTCAVLSDGTVQCWGQIDIASGVFTTSSTPVVFSGISTATAVTVGIVHTCALLSNGTVQCWGFDGGSLLGDGTLAGSFTPVAVSGISTAIVVAAGFDHTCALLSNGTVQCWGSNTTGQLGNGTSGGFSTTPVLVSGITTATAIAVGGRGETRTSHTCALLSDGTVKCWGGNERGQLGNGTAAGSSTPVLVSGISTATAVTAGNEHTCAVLSNGTVQCGGRNNFGQLGNGTTAGSSTPVLVSGISTATAVTAGFEHTCAVLSNGTVKCWGWNQFGQLGDGQNIGFQSGPQSCFPFDPFFSTPCSTTPVLVIGIPKGIWSSSNTAVVTIDANGLATGLSPGTTTITATSDSINGSTTLTVVSPNQPPDVSQARPSPATLWPPNHKFVQISILGVTDPDGDPVTITITRILQDEPVKGKGDGNTAPDAIGLGTAVAQLRAERSGKGNGRVYTITFEARDDKGGLSTGFVTVGVSHDQGKGRVPVNDGALFDSTQ